MSPITCALRLGGNGQLPPAVTMAMVRNQHRTVVLAVPMPAGRTLAKLVVTGKARARDGDLEEQFQKVLTPSSNVATTGRITDTGAGGIALATLAFVPADSGSWPNRLHCQAWAVLSDGQQGPCETWQLHSIAPIPFVLPPDSSLDPNLPPADQATLAWAFDPSYAGGEQTHASRVGPTATLGSTGGVDTNDPTYVATAPARYSYGATHYLNFADALDATLWTDTDGWTLMLAVEYTPASDSGFRALASKLDTGPNRGFATYLESGKPRLSVYANALSLAEEFYVATNAIASGRHVVTYRYDRSQPRGSRLTVLVDGIAVALDAPTVTGTDTGIPDTTASLRVGLNVFGVAPLGVLGPVYAWPGAPLVANLQANDTWLRTTKGWS